MQGKRWDAPAAMNVEIWQRISSSESAPACAMLDCTAGAAHQLPPLHVRREDADVRITVSRSRPARSGALFVAASAAGFSPGGAGFDGGEAAEAAARRAARRSATSAVPMRRIVVRASRSAAVFLRYLTGCQLIAHTTSC